MAMGYDFYTEILQALSLFIEMLHSQNIYLYAIVKIVCLAKKS